MPAKITLELDDKTGPSWDRLEQNSTTALKQVSNQALDVEKALKQVQRAQQRASREAERAARQSIEASQAIGANSREMADRFGFAGESAARLGKEVTDAFFSSSESAAVFSSRLNNLQAGFAVFSEGAGLVEGFTQSVKLARSGVIAFVAANPLAAMSALAVALGAATVAWKLFNDETDESTKKLNEAREAAREYFDELMGRRKLGQEIAKIEQEANFTRLREQAAELEGLIQIETEEKKRLALQEQFEAVQKRMDEINATAREEIRRFEIERFQRLSRDHRARMDALQKESDAAVEARRKERAEAEAAAQAELDLIEQQRAATQAFNDEAARIAEERRKKEVSDAARAFDAEVNLLRKKLEAEAGLRNGTSEVEALGQQLSPQQVIDQIVRQQVASGRKTSSGRQLTEQEVRRLVIREAQQGQLDQREVAFAQQELVKATAQQAHSAGRLSTAQTKAIFEASTAIQDTINEQLRQEQLIEQLQAAVQSTNEGAKRLRAQRRRAGG